MATTPEKNRAYQAIWYKKNRAEHKARVYAQKRKKIAWFREYKKTLKCNRCPEDHPAALDFHHIDPTQKESSIMKLVMNGCSINSIMKEVAKCEVLCSNCHRKHHYNEKMAL